MKAFILVFIPFFAAYFYLTHKLIVVSDLDTILQHTAAKASKDFDGYSEKLLNDLKLTYSLILTLLATTAVVSFVWILLLKYNAKIIVWASIFSLPILICVGLYFCIAQYVHVLQSASNNDRQDTDTFMDQAQGAEKAIQTILHIEFMSYAQNETLLLTVSVSLGVTLVILVVLLHSLRKRVGLSIALIRQASKAINGVKSTLFFPIIPRSVEIGVLVHGIIIMLLIITAGHPSYKIVNGTDQGRPCDIRMFNKSSLLPPPPPHLEPVDPMSHTVSKPSLSWQNNDEIRDRLPLHPPKGINQQTNFAQNQDDIKQRCVKVYLIPREHIWKCHAFNLFATLWLMHFISGISRTTLAGAFASYYWAQRKPEDVPFFAVTISFFRVVKNHLGDIAFGSFLMATIRYIRIIIEIISNRFKRNNTQTTAETIVTGANPARSASCFLRVFFWLLDRFLKYIDRNAYIMMSMYGDGYLESAKRAIKLLYKNSTRALVLDYVTYFVLLVSRLLITGLAGYFAAQQTYTLPLSCKWLPTALVIIGAYFISKGLFSVYSMAVDTLFICFLIDSSHNDGSAERPYFMPKDLRRVMKRTLQKSTAA